MTQRKTLYRGLLVMLALILCLTGIVAVESRQQAAAEGEVQRPMQDSKGQLQELLQKDGGDTPTYQITGTSGPPHAPVFEAAVFRGGKEIGRGTGRTKKQAEQAAALAALKALQSSGSC